MSPYHFASSKVYDSGTFKNSTIYACSLSLSLVFISIRSVRGCTNTRRISPDLLGCDTQVVIFPGDTHAGSDTPVSNLRTWMCRCVSQLARRRITTGFACRNQRFEVSWAFGVGHFSLRPLFFFGPRTLGLRQERGRPLLLWRTCMSFLPFRLFFFFDTSCVSDHNLPGRTLFWHTYRQTEEVAPS